MRSLVSPRAAKVEIEADGIGPRIGFHPDRISENGWQPEAARVSLGRERLRQIGWAGFS